MFDGGDGRGMVFRTVSPRSRNETGDSFTQPSEFQMSLQQVHQLTASGGQRLKSLRQPRRCCGSRRREARKSMLRMLGHGVEGEMGMPSQQLAQMLPISEQ